MPSLIELERIAARGWQGTSSESLGGWLLRAGNGFTGRANSVLTLEPPGLPLDEALDRVAAFYRDRGLPQIFQIPYHPGDPQSAAARLTADLLDRGWIQYDDVSVLVGTLDELRLDALRVGTPRHDPEPSTTWLTGYHYRGKPLPANAVDVLVNADSPTFLTLLDDDGTLLGVARGVVTDGWLGVTAVTVPPEHRRRGVGSALMAELARWARDRGATDAYLQVDPTNAAAMAMYRRSGFTEHHRYRYLRAPGA